MRAKWVAGIGLIVAGMAGLAVWAIVSPGAVSYFVTPTELRTSPPKAESLRLGGRVAPGTLVRKGSVIAFDVTDGRNQVPVRYSGEIPDTLKERTDVVATGRLSADGTLVAERVMAKCSSKFVPEVESTARRRA